MGGWERASDGYVQRVDNPFAGRWRLASAHCVLQVDARLQYRISSQREGSRTTVLFPCAAIEGVEHRPEFAFVMGR